VLEVSYTFDPKIIELIYLLPLTTLNVENRSIFTAPANGDERHKNKKKHIIVKSINSSLRSESKSIFNFKLREKV